MRFPASRSIEFFLVAISIYVAIPALMIFLVLVLKPSVNRSVNVVLGVVYAVTILLSVVGDDYVYLIVWYAWKWPLTSCHPQAV